MGRVKLLSAAGSAAVLFNGIKESWRLVRKILSQFKLLWFLNVFLVTHYSSCHSPLGNSNKNFLLPAALGNLTRPLIRRRRIIQPHQAGDMKYVLPHQRVYVSHDGLLGHSVLRYTTQGWSLILSKIGRKHQFVVDLFFGVFYAKTPEYEPQRDFYELFSHIAAKISTEKLFVGLTYCLQ